MESWIVLLEPNKLVGIHIEVSLASGIGIWVKQQGAF